MVHWLTRDLAAAGKLPMEWGQPGAFGSLSYLDLFSNTLTGVDLMQYQTLGNFCKPLRKVKAHAQPVSVACVILCSVCRCMQMHHHGCSTCMHVPRYCIWPVAHIYISTKNKEKREKKRMSF